MGWAFEEVWTWGTCIMQHKHSYSSILCAIYVWCCISSSFQSSITVQQVVPAVWDLKVVAEANLAMSGKKIMRLSQLLCLGLSDWSQY
jgi:hypothetical protein